MAKKKTPAQKTWTQENLLALANAYAALNQGTPPPGVPQPAPFNPNADPGYVAQTGAINSGLADLYATLGVSFDANGNPVFSGGQYLQGAQNYGFDEAGNPIASGDTRYNPFNELERLKTSFENRKRGTLNSYAAAGHLYSGALKNAQTTDATNYAQNYDTLQRGAKSFYSGLVANALQGKNTAALNIANAGSTALGNQLAQHANDPPPVLTPNLGPTPAAAPKPVVRKKGFRVRTPGVNSAKRFSGSY